MDVPLRSRRGSLALIGLAGLAGCALSFTPADAQQVIAGKGSVTIDLGVLDQLGPPVAGAYAPGGQASSYPAAGYSQPRYGPTSQTRGARGAEGPAGRPAGTPPRRAEPAPARPAEWRHPRPRPQGNGRDHGNTRVNRPRRHAAAGPARRSGSSTGPTGTTSGQQRER